MQFSAWFLVKGGTVGLKPARVSSKCVQAKTNVVLVS